MNERMPRAGVGVLEIMQALRSMFPVEPRVDDTMDSVEHSIRLRSRATALRDELRMVIDRSAALRQQCGFARRAHPISGGVDDARRRYDVICSCGYRASMRTLGQAASALERHLNENPANHSATIHQPHMGRDTGSAS